MNKYLISILILLLAGCQTPIYRYSPVPKNLIPIHEEPPKIKSSDLMCLSDETYTALVKRDRLCQQENRELRALLGN